MNPSSKKPKLLDWIKQRTGRYHEDFDPRAYGHETWASVWREQEEDRALVKIRDETGKEPPSRNEKKIERPKPSWER